MKVQTAEKDQMKYFAQNYQGKITVFYVQTAAWFSAAKRISLFKSVESVIQDFFTIKGTARFWKYYTMNDLHTKYNTSSKHKKTKAI